MRPASLLAALAFSVLLAAPVAAAEVTIDGVPGATVMPALPADPGPSALTNIDIVGDTGNSSTRAALAKGNSYRVDVDIVLYEAEFWLTFSNTQNLIFYVFESPVEFGTYTQIYSDMQAVTGTGSAWYSSGPLSIPMLAGMHYIIAVSWDGTLTYYYGTGDEQPTSFGAHTHGYAVGTNPLPTIITSTSNDQAIYHQRLTSDFATAVDEATWGRIKSLYE